jgi:deazaflavin-dependent oxidoreductase (nitroreductase family)
MGLGDEPYVYVTTTGRVSGLPREIEIWFVLHLGAIYIFAEHFERTHWVKNISKNPRVAIRLAQHELQATARILDESRNADLWKTTQDLARTKYGWGDGLPVEIRPDRPLPES